jgi:hypothetical protein
LPSLGGGVILQQVIDAFPRMKRGLPESRFPRATGWLAALLFAPAILGAGPAFEATEHAADRGSWKFTTGVLWRRIGDVTFDDGYEPVPRPVFPPINYMPPLPGSYADGYVFSDSGSGTTSHFGYDNDSQVGADTLTFSKVRFMERHVVDMDNHVLRSQRDDAGTAAAPYLSITRDWRLNEKTTAGITWSFSTMDVEGSRNGASVFRMVERTDYLKVSSLEVYNTGGTVLPPAPYRGIPDQSSPRIPTTPFTSSSTEPELVSSVTRTSTDSLDQRFDMDLHGMALGGCLEYEPCPRLGMRAGAGLVMNLADWNASSTQVAMMSPNGGTNVVAGRADYHAKGTDLLGGLYLETALLWKIDSRWSVECSARYDWTQSLNGRIGQGGFNVDLDGWSVGLGVSYRY